jgi:hypothetical protein
MESMSEQRKTLSEALAFKYPDRVPVIIKKNKNNKILQDIDKKYLIPKNLTISYVMYIIRKKIKLDEKQALFLFVNNTLVPLNTTVGELYTTHKSIDDLFLYIYYTTENTFG